eukprot:m.130511 g.130511  ORF g.130511 m.130511 type:complete len:132 (+) comp14604_c0_seq7:1722-2117(+)
MTEDEIGGVGGAGRGVDLPEIETEIAEKAAKGEDTLILILDQKMTMDTVQRKRRKGRRKKNPRTERSPSLTRRKNGTVQMNQILMTTQLRWRKKRKSYLQSLNQPEKNLILDCDDSCNQRHYEVFFILFKL